MVRALDGRSSGATYREIAAVLFEAFGFTPDHVAARAMALVKRGD